MDQVALDFAKASPFLIEEYRFMKRGIEMKPINRATRTLHQILKQFIRMEEIGRFEIFPINCISFATSKPVVFLKFLLLFIHSD